MILDVLCRSLEEVGCFDQGSWCLSRVWLAGSRRDGISLLRLFSIIRFFRRRPVIVWFWISLSVLLVIQERLSLKKRLLIQWHKATESIHSYVFLWRSNVNMLRKAKKTKQMKGILLSWKGGWCFDSDFLLRVDSVKKIVNIESVGVNLWQWKFPNCKEFSHHLYYLMLPNITAVQRYWRCYNKQRRRRLPRCVSFIRSGQLQQFCFYSCIKHLIINYKFAGLWRWLNWYS